MVLEYMFFIVAMLDAGCGVDGVGCRPQMATAAAAMTWLAWVSLGIESWDHQGRSVSINVVSYLLSWHLSDIMRRLR